TWEWDGSNWTQQSPATSPSARTFHAMAYDLVRQRTVLFGGWDMVLNFFLSDTWEWDGSNWVARGLGPLPERAEAEHALVHAAAGERVVCFGEIYFPPNHLGGPADDTWLFGPLTPAVAQSFGTGCAGSSGPPVLTSNAPYLGNPAFALDLLSALSASPCV